MVEGIPASQVVDEVEKRLMKYLQPINERLEKLEGQTAGRKVYPSGGFKLFDAGPGTTSILAECPSCGFHDAIPKAVETQTVEKVVEKPVEKIPEGYIPAPGDWDGIKRILEAKHADGKSIWECPNCSKGFQELAEQHGYRKVK